MVSEPEKTERLAAVRSALASQRIEGLEPDASVICDAALWASGQLTISTAIANYIATLHLKAA